MGGELALGAVLGPRRGDMGGIHVLADHRHVDTPGHGALARLRLGQKLRASGARDSRGDAAATTADAVKTLHSDTGDIAHKNHAI